MTKMIHSFWAYLVLILLIMAVFNAYKGFRSKRTFSTKDLRLSLFTLVASHIQLIIGLVAYYLSNYYATMRSIGMGEVMKNSELRKPLVEHPVMIIIAVTLLTIGFTRIKRKESDRAKFKSIFVYYALALIVILLMIPWDLWFSS
jgi:ABC-type branched-subunit amino acid transport system permease subunit